MTRNAHALGSPTPAAGKRPSAYCTLHQVSTSHLVQKEPAEWLAAAKARETNAKPVPEPDLSFLSADDPLRRYTVVKIGSPSIEEWMRITRGDDWNQP